MDSLETYERNYKHYQRLVKPQVLAIKTQIDIFPTQQTCHVTAQYQLTNPGKTPISEIFVTAIKPLQKITICGGCLTLQDSDELWHVYLFKLDNPLLSGDTRVLSYQLQHASHPFAVDNNGVSNGTFFNQGEFEPRLGFDDSLQIMAPEERLQRGLPQTPNQSKSNPLTQLHHFESIISTSAGQTAVTSGHLLRRWEKQGRSYFHYQMNKKQMVQNIDLAIGYFSARYQPDILNHKGLPLPLYFQPIDRDVSENHNGIEKINKMVHIFSCYITKYVAVLKHACK